MVTVGSFAIERLKAKFAGFAWLDFDFRSLSDRPLALLLKEEGQNLRVDLSKAPHPDIYFGNPCYVRSLRALKQIRKKIFHQVYFMHPRYSCQVDE